MRLIIVDTTGIQPYIFGSNRLRENIGASHLVAQATEQWAFEVLRSMASNVRANGSLNEELRIEEPTHNLAAEVVYAGGGNIVVIFRDEPEAREFTSRLSRKALTDAPDLQLVVARREFEWSDSLYEQVKNAFKTVAQMKRTRALSAPLLGVSVSVMCQSTGLPAVGMTQNIGEDDGYPASAEIHAKLAIATKRGREPSEAGARLRKQIPPAAAYDYPREFKDLGGSTGDQSYIAVVHADGNGMGQRIMDIGKAHAAASQNRAYVTALRGFSDAVEHAAQGALKETLNQLVSRIDGGRIVHPHLTKLAVPLSYDKETGIPYLPFRPIVFGGDDVTFVCDGRLGLSLAIEFLNQFELHTANLSGGKVTACAGIAIVKSHYPFARAYKLAEDLCSTAKKYRRDEKLDDSCLDWHFAMSGLSGGIEEIRAREYAVRAGSLTLRPVTLAANPKQAHRSWEVVQRGVTEFQKKKRQDRAEKAWAERRNKIKALRDALRDGSAAVKSFLIKFNEAQPLPEVCPSLANLKDEGWHGKICGYFDAVEMIDWFIPLQGGEANETGIASGATQ